jgi:hypothetical protein
MDRFSGMRFVCGGAPIMGDRFVVKKETSYIVLNDDGEELAVFGYEDGNEKSKDKALEDALSVCIPDRN